MNRKVCKRKVDTRDDLLARILDAAARIRKREDQLRLRLTVGFSNIYCEVQQICHFKY